VSYDGYSLYLSVRVTHSLSTVAYTFRRATPHRTAHAAAWSTNEATAPPDDIAIGGGGAAEAVCRHVHVARWYRRCNLAYLTHPSASSSWTSCHPCPWMRSARQAAAPVSRSKRDQCSARLPASRPLPARGTCQGAPRRVRSQAAGACQPELGSVAGARSSSA
jgi:hypothetical protein